MAIHSKNQLYVACLGSVWIFDTKTEKQSGKISMPVEKLTNCAFVEGDGTLCITTQKGFS